MLKVGVLAGPRLSDMVQNAITKQSEAKNVNGMVEEEKEELHIHTGLWREITKLMTK
jgi:hypothetical protein